MDFSISKIHNKGDYKEEYVSLKVEADCDAGQYILADSTYTADGNISAKLRHVFWLPDMKVNKGDYIWIHTKSGTPSKNVNRAKTQTHHIYWGLKSSVWNDDGDCAALFHYDEWTNKGVK
jgi:hypothetical protein